LAGITACQPALLVKTTPEGSSRSAGLTLGQGIRKVLYESCATKILVDLQRSRARTLLGQGFRIIPVTMDAHRRQIYPRSWSKKGNLPQFPQERGDCVARVPKRGPIDFRDNEGIREEIGSKKRKARFLGSPVQGGNSYIWK